MRNFTKIIYIVFSLIFLFYLCLPNPTFPFPPSDALQSNEPGDTETTLRRAYFTNYTREEVIQHYLGQLKESNFYNLPLPTYRLNYPPEEAQTIIRDQTRSTFLEEIVHPFRESVFVNGFEPKDPKDAVFIQGKIWRQKITVRHSESNPFIRIFLGAACLIIIPYLAKNCLFGFSNLKKEVFAKWIFRS